MSQMKIILIFLYDEFIRYIIIIIKKLILNLTYFITYYEDKFSLISFKVFLMIFDNLLN